MTEDEARDAYVKARHRVRMLEDRLKRGGLSDRTKKRYQNNYERAIVERNESLVALVKVVNAQ
jgi:hypothetical protein